MSTISGEHFSKIIEDFFEVLQKLNWDQGRFAKCFHCGAMDASPYDDGVDDFHTFTDYCYTCLPPIGECVKGCGYDVELDEGDNDCYDFEKEEYYHTKCPK